MGATNEGRRGWRVEQASDFGQCDTLVAESHDLSDPLHVSFAVQPVSGFGAYRLDQPIPAFPGAQGNGVDSGHLGYRSDRV